MAGIGGAEITAYALKRQGEGAANGYENRKLLRLPVIRRLKEAAPRQRFFEFEEFEAVRKYLSDDLKAAVSIAYVFGWRIQTERL